MRALWFVAGAGAGVYVMVRGYASSTYTLVIDYTRP